ncbi:uncharacterized protein [Macrobrachium rosenbergii]|uniref:uncharacterized protein n=1 Tax=Macrobrachium rosenbergii TaxID=79674 RepID=UPI0034D3A6DE
MSSNAKSFFPLSIPVTKNYWGNIHQRTPREYSTASSIAYQQQLQPNSVIDKGIDQKEPSNSSFSVTSSYQHLQRREDPVKAKQVQHPSFMEVLGGGAASVVTALLVNAGASFISDRTGLPLRRRRSAENSSAETDLVVEEAVKLWAAIEDRDSCRARSWCRLGRVVGSFEGGPSATLLANYLFGSWWEEELDHIMSGAFASDCSGWECGMDVDRYDLA